MLRDNTNAFPQRSAPIAIFPHFSSHFHSFSGMLIRQPPSSALLNLEKKRVMTLNEKRTRNIKDRTQTPAYSSRSWEEWVFHSFFFQIEKNIKFEKISWKNNFYDILYFYTSYINLKYSILIQNRNLISKQFIDHSNVRDTIEHWKTSEFFAEDFPSPFRST